MRIELDVEGELKAEARKMLEACHEFWRAKNRLGLSGAVHWVQDDDGRLVVFTRGEYADVIRRAIMTNDGFDSTSPTLTWGGDGTRSPSPLRSTTAPGSAG